MLRLLHSYFIYLIINHDHIDSCMRMHPLYHHQSKDVIMFISQIFVSGMCQPYCKYLEILTSSVFSFRYIQGARLISNSSPSVINSLDASQGTAELAANNSKSKSETGTPTFCARFVGQGYKQVTYRSVCVRTRWIYRSHCNPMLDCLQYAIHTG